MTAMVCATHGVVFKLIEGIEYRIHHVCMDNYYKPHPFYLSATAWVRSVWYCLSQQARDAQGSHNMYMGGVDKADQQMSYFMGLAIVLSSGGDMLFFHRFENATVNAYILYRLSVQDGRKMDHKQFRIELAKKTTTY